MRQIQVKRRCITLIEIMIVMFLIALITGVIAYNYRGGLEKGKVFKTEMGMERLETIINLGVAENPSLEEDIESSWKQIVRDSPLVKNPDSLIRDGWGGEYKVSYEDGKLKISSDKYDEYKKSN